MSHSPPSQAAEAWREHYPFASHQRLVGGRWRMNYVDEGPRESAAPTLLFVHGNPTWSFHWRRLISGFSGRFRAVAPDHIGCGLSEKPSHAFRLEDRVRHLVELVDALDLQNTILVAQDWGGAIGLGALLRRRDRFAGVLLMNTGAFRPWFIPLRIRVCRTPLVGRLALQGLNLFSRAALRMTVARERLPYRVAEAYLAPYNSWPNRRAVYEFVRDIPLSASHPTWATLGQIEDALPSLAGLPTGLVWGIRDWCFTPECLRRFKAVWPDASVREIADAGHWIMEDAPEAVVEELESLLGRVAAHRAPQECAQ